MDIRVYGLITATPPIVPTDGFEDFQNVMISAVMMGHQNYTSAVLLV